MTTYSRKLQPRGSMLLEAMLVAAILAIMVTAAVLTMTTSAAATQQSGEYAVVAGAAQQMLEELSATRFEDLVSRFGTSGSVGNTFVVNRNYTMRGSDVRLPGFSIRNASNQLIEAPAGEIVIITNESTDPKTLGRDLAPRRVGGVNGRTDGVADGVNFKGMPMDLNGDGNTTSGECWGATSSSKTAVRFPVGVIIRWPGSRGDERFELWTVLSKF